MTEKALVVQTYGKKAIIEVKRMSACEGCHNNRDGQGCSACSLLGGSKVLRSEAYNPVGALCGDVVTVESSTSRMLLYAALIFICPIVVGIAAYFITASFSDNEIIRSLTAVGSFLLMCGCAVLYSSSLSGKRCDITITGIVSTDRVQKNK